MRHLVQLEPEAPQALRPKSLCPLPILVCQLLLGGDVGPNRLGGGGGGCGAVSWSALALSFVAKMRNGGLIRSGLGGTRSNLTLVHGIADCLVLVYGDGLAHDVPRICVILLRLLHVLQL